MYYLIFKILLSALMIATISEISKRSSLIGGTLASLPLVSLLAIIWMYIETKDIDKISKLSYSIFWLVIPSLSFFLVLPLFLKFKINFYFSLFLSLIVMTALYYLQIFILKKIGVNI
ncbi:DUF3147 family protein [Candidatus Dependentiae bacterium]|nr:DUF3147 family protein [Candidatus Dependentiae bacterium]